MTDYNEYNNLYGNGLFFDYEEGEDMSCVEEDDRDACYYEDAYGELVDRAEDMYENEFYEDDADTY